MGTYVQYGCGHSAPTEWINFDISPTLRIQKTPVLGGFLQKKLNTTFPSNVRYGDIVKGLPIENNTCDGLYCSHVLEHLSFEDFQRALKNSFGLLRKGGIFRCIVPDLATAAKIYVDELNVGNNQASIKFMSDTSLGLRKRPKGIREIVSSLFGNSQHLWMWDNISLAEELRAHGFTDIRNCFFNDCKDPMFKLVEERSRFVSAVALECKK
jgi:predicted SAM-dependent methyltransferase